MLRDTCQLIRLPLLVLALCAPTVSAQMVVAGQENGPRVTVIDVTNPAMPIVRGSVLTTLTGISSVAVAPNGSIALAGELNGCRVARIDISNPDNPIETGTLCLSFVGVSSVAIGTGNRAIAGQQFGPRVQLLDISGATPTALGTALLTTLVGIKSVAASGACGIAGEENGNRAVGITISGGSATIAGTALNMGFPGVSSVGMDGTRALAGEQFGNRIRGLSVSGCALSLGGLLNVTGITGVKSVSVSGTRALVGEENGPDVAVINVQNVASLALVGSPLNSGFAGVSAVAANGTTGAIGQQFGPGIRTITALTGTPALGGSVLTSVAGISSVAFTSFSPPHAVVAASLIFGNVNVGMSQTLGLTVQNTGGAALTLSAITSSSPRFVPAATSLTVPAFGTGMLNITFTPNAAGVVSATLAANTNDPLNPTISVALSGTGVIPPPAIVVPATLAFGVVRVGQTVSSPLSIQNTGGQTLQVTSISSSSPRFVPANTSLSIGSGSTQNLNIAFSPNAEASFSGTLTANTNDPANPTISVSLSGTGGLPHIAVSPTSIAFGNVAVCQSATQMLTVSNTGDAPLVVSSIDLPAGDFSRTPAGMTVAGMSSALVQVTFAPSATGAANATITLVNDDPDPLKQNLAVPLSGNGTPMPPPAISVTPTSIAFGATLVNFFIGRRVTIENTGPCAPLNVTLTSSSSVFPVTADPNPATVPPFGTVSQSIAPGASQSFVSVFAPTVAAPATGTLTVTSDDPANPTVPIALGGTGVLASASSVSLVLDRSGSMGTALGSGGTKLDALKTSARLFTDLIVEGQGDRLGTVEFDDLFSVLTPIADVTAGHKATVKSGIDGLFARGMTSVGGGLQTGLAQLSGATTPRSVVLVFTDGMENRAPMIAAVKPMIPAGTEVYSIGLGDPATISAAALSDLAITSGGRFFNPQDPLVLRKDFVQVLSDAFRVNMAADPIYTITPGATQTRFVPLSNCDHRISFIVYWENPATALAVEVVAPNGMVYTPAAPVTNRLVRYVARPGYKFYQIAFPPIAGTGTAIGPPRTGNWMVRVRGDTVRGTSERYSLSVIVESSLSLDLSITGVQFGKAPTVQARLMESGRPVSNAVVTARLSRPSRSIGQVLASAPTSLRVLASRPDARKDSLTMRARLTQLLLRRARNAFGPLIRPRVTSHALAMSGEGSFGASVPALTIDGGHQLEVRAQAGACGGLVTREATLSFYVPLLIDSAGTRVDVTAGQVAGAYTVTVRPRGGAGTMLGPGLVSLVRAEVSGGGRVLRIRDNSDGTYAIAVRDAKPGAVLRLDIAGTTVTVPLRRRPS